MAFNGNGQALVGDDGKVYSATIGTEQTGDGLASLDEGFYLVTAVGDPTTGWPAVSGATGAVAIQPGYIIKVSGDDSIIPETGDKYKELTLTSRCDVQDWSGSWTKTAIDVTSLCDTQTVYAAGKADFTGTINGVTKIGDTTGPEGFLRSFITIIQQDGDTSIDLYEKTDEILFAYLVMREGDATADEQGLFLPIEIYGAGVGGTIGSAQTFSSEFRIANSADVKPALYRFAFA